MNIALSLLFFVLFPQLGCGAPDDPSAKLDAFLTPLHQSAVPGLSITVVDHGQVLYQKGFGLRDLTLRTPIDPHTRFELASVSKQLTAMGVMVLKERGILTYETPITRYFPEFESFASRVTVRDLLQHTSGFPDYMELCKLGRPIKNADVIELLAHKAKLEFAPGEKHDYSNSGYAVLASLIERASGERFPEFMDHHVFGPLGMRESFVSNGDAVKLSNVAQSYIKNQPVDGPEVRDCNSVYGDGSIFSNVVDLVFWNRELDQPTLISASSLREAFLPGHTTNGKSFPYGFGWDLEPFHGFDAISHTGIWAGYFNLLVRYLNPALTVIVLSNGYSDNANDAVVKAHEFYSAR